MFAIDFYLIFNEVAKFLKQGDSAEETTANKTEGGCCPVGFYQAHSPIQVAAWGPALPERNWSFLSAQVPGAFTALLSSHKAGALGIPGSAHSLPS